MRIKKKLDRLLAVREHALNDPDSFDMHDWFKFPSGSENASLGNTCGTAACAAGWAVHDFLGSLSIDKDEDGYKRVLIGDLTRSEAFRKDIADHPKFYKAYAKSMGQDTSKGWYVTGSWTAVGARILGLTWPEADILFTASSTEKALQILDVYTRLASYEEAKE